MTYYYKKGLSGIIVTLILIGISLAAAGLVWVVIKNIIDERTSSTTSCFNAFEKISINNRYSCYNASGNELHVSVELKDLNPEKVIVTIYGNSSSKSFDIPGTYNYVKLYSGSYSEAITLPSNNSAKTYIVNMAHSSVNIGTPDSFEIYPVINGNQCDAIDDLQNIDTC